METNTITDGLEIRTRTNRPDERPAKGRVYVSLPDFNPQPTDKCADEACGSAWCQAARRDDRPEHTEVDHKQWNRWLRTELRLTKERILPALAEHWSIPQEQIILRFSRNAGCSCGCSPGFIVDGTGGRTWATSTWVKRAIR